MILIVLMYQFTISMYQHYYLLFKRAALYNSCCPQPSKLCIQCTHYAYLYMYTPTTALLTAK